MTAQQDLIAEAVDDQDSVSAPTTKPDKPFPRRRGDISAIALFSIAAFYLTGLLWIDPVNRVPATADGDHAFFLWMFAHAAHAVTHGLNPMLDLVMNVPYGVNLMANTSVLAFAIPFTPITLWLGPGVSYVAMLTIAYAATAIAWYWLLSRHVVTNRAAALLGAAVCGFGPGMISQGNGHPNIVAQFLVPLIIWRALKLREGRSIRNGLILALLVVWQAFINEEVLFLTAVGMAIFVGFYALLRRAEARAVLAPMVKGLAVAGVAAGLLLAYPLWFQFFGPQHYRGLPAGVSQFGTDVAAITSFSRTSFFGDPQKVEQLTPNRSEENTFFGWPLIVGLGAMTVWMWRSVLVRVLTFTGLSLLALSLAPKVTVYQHNTSLPGPMKLLGMLPIFDTLVPIRVGLFVLPVIGVLVALGVTRLMDVTTGGSVQRRFVYAAIALALIPLAPMPLRVVDRPLPDFIAQGLWRDHIPEGRSLVTLPLASSSHNDGLRWGASTNLGFSLAAGYFLGPDGKDGSRFGPPIRPTMTLFNEAARDGKPADITDADRAAVAADLKHWRAGTIVLGQMNFYWYNETRKKQAEEAVKITAERLFGTPQRVGGLWVWDVDDLDLDNIDPPR